MTKAPPCGEPTRRRRPCRNPPLAGRAGCKCGRHGLETTEAQKLNALTHGLHLHGLLPGEQELYQQAREDPAGKGELHRDHLAYARVRLARVMKYEAESGQPTPAVAVAFAQVGRLIAALPDEPEEPHACLDAAQVEGQVRSLMQDPKVFLDTLDSTTAAKVAQLLGEAGRMTPATPPGAPAPAPTLAPAAPLPVQEPPAAEQGQGLPQSAPAPEPAVAQPAQPAEAENPTPADLPKGTPPQQAPARPPPSAEERAKRRAAVLARLSRTAAAPAPSMPEPGSPEAEAAWRELEQAAEQERAARNGNGPAGADEAPPGAGPADGGGTA